MIRYSQQDPLWKNKTLGTGDCTIGSYGCFLTCFAMLAEVDPLTLNDALVDLNGFDGSLIIPGFVPLVSSLKLGNPVSCPDDPAPLDVIDDALASGKSVIVGINKNSHYVILTGKVGADYSMVDPWPITDNPPATLLGRYGKGRDAKTIITYILVVDAGKSADPITSTPTGITTGNVWLRTAPVVCEDSKFELLPAGRVVPIGDRTISDGRAWRKVELYIAEEYVK